ncbi:MAG: trehalose-phosphatase [Desulfuromonas sp.]|nr:MAG: trehalose-phosphatase [Desulfuromonas sp.]
MSRFSAIDNFWIKLAAARSPVLLLDYDGTLAPFCVERDQAFPYPGVRELLEHIRKTTDTRLVIISGRAIDDLLPLLAIDPPPEVWGCHGWEQLGPDGDRHPVEITPQARLGLNLAGQWLEAQGLMSQMEVKPASLALHWRGLDQAEQQSLGRKVADGWRSLALEHGLELHPFDGGVELRCPGRDKGSVVSRILDEVGPDAVVAFLGDDLTDEDGFKAIAARGLGVLVRREYRVTAARGHLIPPGELIDFLQNWLEVTQKAIP